MSGPADRDRGDVRRQALQHGLLIVLVAVVYQAQFLYHPPNPIDEGWPLYAAQRLHDGGTLYADTFFVFPPGHLLAAWIGHAIAPPGLIAARILYGVFDLSLCLALYLLGRRLMPAHLALLAALLVALATPRAHAHHNVFGFRYLVWSVLALIAFARATQSEDRRWLLAAGALAGVATAFRLTPGFAVSVAIGLATLLLPGGPRRWLRDWGAYAFGLTLVLVPLVSWAAADIGLATLWREAVVRPVVMTEQQSLPLPPLWPLLAGTREEITASFVSLQFRLYPIVLAAQGIALAFVLLRSLRAGRRFPEPLLACCWLFSLVYFTRALGRSDEAHLVSALPPLCLLLVYGLAALAPSLRDPARGVRAGALVLIVWIGLWGSDQAFMPLLRDWNWTGAEASGGPRWSDWRAELLASQHAARDRIESQAPKRVVLDLSARPLMFTTGELTGPGWLDVVMPGTFMSDAEEQAFIERLEAAPPEGVFWPAVPFDEMEARGPDRSAPALARWAERNIGPTPGELAAPDSASRPGRNSSSGRR